MIENKTPLILITNDDGIDAPGINHLADMVKDLGNIMIVAPDGARSGASASITSLNTLHADVRISTPSDTRIAVNGTPVDCIKLALNMLVQQRPDIIISGINHGSNAAVNEMYSGTMGAVYEGTLAGIPSVGYSLCDHSKDADFKSCAQYIHDITKRVLLSGLPKDVCLNINFPIDKVIKGAKVLRTAHGRWTEEYNKIVEADGSVRYQLTGHFENAEPDNAETDEYWLARGYASVVPVQPYRDALAAHKYVATEILI